MWTRGLMLKAPHGRRGAKVVVIVFQAQENALKYYTHRSDKIHQKSHGWDSGCNLVVEHLYIYHNGKKKEFAQIRPKQTYKMPWCPIFVSLLISQFLIKVAQTRQMDLAFLILLKIEMCRYGLQGDSGEGSMSDGLSLCWSYFVDLLLNNSSFVLTINQVIPLCSILYKNLFPQVIFPLCII